MALAQRGHRRRKCVAGLGKPMQQDYGFRPRADVAVIDCHAVDICVTCFDRKSSRLRGLLHGNLLGVDFSCHRNQP
jgi:hypothetical protein